MQGSVHNIARTSFLYQGWTYIIDQLQVEKTFVLFFETIVFNALIPNILLSRLFDEQKCIFSHLKSADFETVCDWSTSP